MNRNVVMALSLFFALGTACAQNFGQSMVNTVVVRTIGDVHLLQGDRVGAMGNSDSSVRKCVRLVDSVMYVSGIDDFDIMVPELKYLVLDGVGDVRSEGRISGSDLSVYSHQVGDISLNFECDNVYLKMVGTGDVTFRGSCDALFVEQAGTGDFNAKSLNDSFVFANYTGTGDFEARAAGKSALCYSKGTGNQRIGGEVVFANTPVVFAADGMKENGIELDEMSVAFFANESVRNWDLWKTDKVDGVVVSMDSATIEAISKEMDRWERNMERWAGNMDRWVERRVDRHGNRHYEHSVRYERKTTLLYDAHWNGFEAGLNMLFDPSTMNTFSGENGAYAIKPMKSWYFGFNIADVGLSFDRRHTCGAFTGVGLGWNNFSWLNDYMTVSVDGYAHNEFLGSLVLPERSKLGMLYLQFPLMVEVSPRRNAFYCDLGVTAGVRLSSWSKMKKYDGPRYKVYDDFGLNFFKLDASLRVGGDNLGLFVNYALLPMASGGDLSGVHPLSVGFSLNF